MKIYIHTHKKKTVKRWKRKQNTVISSFILVLKVNTSSVREEKQGWANSEAQWCGFYKWHHYLRLFLKEIKHLQAVVEQ